MIRSMTGFSEALLQPHRREICVVFIDLRGFTAFTDSAEPEEVMEMLNAYHAQMGALVLAHDGTLERFAGDSLMVFFNDPQPVDQPAEQAVRMALEMQQAFRPLGELCHSRRAAFCCHSEYQNAHRAAVGTHTTPLAVLDSQPPG